MKGWPSELIIRELRKLQLRLGYSAVRICMRLRKIIRVRPGRAAGGPVRPVAGLLTEAKELKRDWMETRLRQDWKKTEKRTAVPVQSSNAFYFICSV